MIDKEAMRHDEGCFEDAIRTIINHIGEDQNREGLRDTPWRVRLAYEEMFAGYNEKVEDLMTVFEDGACDEQIVMRGIQFVSHCEHHMLPFSGVAHIGYIPDGRIIGASKLSRLLDVYAKRLQVQERLTVQVTRALETHLKPLGAACVIEATHGCFTCRGIRKSPTFVTSSLTGAYRNEPETRAEFFKLAGL